MEDLAENLLAHTFNVKNVVDDRYALFYNFRRKVMEREMN
jgi:hypothetical protein